jgi:hypothetical protein
VHHGVMQFILVRQGESLACVGNQGGILVLRTMGGRPLSKCEEVRFGEFVLVIVGPNLCTRGVP